MVGTEGEPRRRSSIPYVYNCFCYYAMCHYYVTHTFAVVFFFPMRLIRRGRQRRNYISSGVSLPRKARRESSTLASRPARLQRRCNFESKDEGERGSASAHASYLWIAIKSKLTLTQPEKMLRFCGFYAFSAFEFLCETH
ncbi:hypothetical protein Ddc_09672 [Ditylenchus destructor]|nr:hypothetical protein Ddc_09672 [Ditylenchus destructor]